VSELRAAKTELESSLKSHREETDAALVALQSDKKMLQVELAHYERRLGEGTALRETAVVSAISGLEEQARRSPQPQPSPSPSRPANEASASSFHGLHARRVVPGLRCRIIECTSAAEGPLHAGL